MRYLIIIIIIIFTSSSAIYRCNGSEPIELEQNKAIEIFTLANEEYQRAQRLMSTRDIEGSLAGFKRAAEQYERLIHSGYINGQIYYNLASASYRQGSTGKAVLYYRKAAKLMPRNADLKANLRLVKTELKDKALERDVPDVIKTTFYWHFFLNLDEVTTLAISFYMTFIACLGSFIFFRYQWLKRLWVGFGVVLAVASISLGIKIYTEHSVLNGVVLADECEVRYGPGEEYEPKFKIHEGVEFLIEDEKDGWYKVYVYVGVRQSRDEKEIETIREHRTGWIPKDEAGVI